MGGKKKARAIEKLTAANRDLKRTLSGLRGQLTKSETKLAKANEKVARWKKEAAALRTAASRSDARVERLQKKLDRATAALSPVRASGPNQTGAVAGSLTQAQRVRVHSPRQDVDRGPASGRSPGARTNRNVEEVEAATPRRLDLTDAGAAIQELACAYFRRSHVNRSDLPSDSCPMGRRKTQVAAIACL